MNKKTDDLSIRELSEILSKHVTNQDFFRELQFYTQENQSINNNYYGKNMRRVNYLNCSFISANFGRAGFSNGVFTDCIFDNVNFKGATLVKCRFINCIFKGPIIGANFDSSEFSNTTFYSSIIRDTIFSNTILSGCKFKESTWTSVLLENAVLNNTSLSSIKFRKLNFELVHIKNVSFENCRLPFQAIPYMIGGFTYLKCANESVFFKSNTKKNKLLSKEEYITLIPYMKAFYEKTNNYFPLSNIYIYNEDYLNAYNSIIAGIKYAISIQQYQMIDSFCDLFLETDGFSIENRVHMAKDVLSLMTPFISTIEDRNILKQMLLCRNKLSYYSENACSLVTIKTNISPERSDLVGKIIQDFDPLFNNHNIRYHYEIRHNSPYEIAILILDNAASLLSITASIASIAASIVALKIALKGKRSLPQKEEQINIEQTITNNIMTTIQQNNIEIEINVTNFNE